MLETISDEIWSVPSPLRFGGLSVGTRMTIIRRADGELVLVSPVPISAGLVASIESLGKVGAIIVPNLLHHLYAGDWLSKLPDARSYGPPGIAKKRPDLALDREIGPDFDDAEGPDIVCFPIGGMPALAESLFLHRPSSTLIATDFCFFMPEATGLTALFASVTGIKKKVKCEPLFRMMIKDTAAFRSSLLPLRALEIQHLSMCHHSVRSMGATEALQAVLDQLSVPSNQSVDRVD